MTPDQTRARYEAEEQLRIHEEVGRGGYGRVYRAHHLRLDTPVAVKVLNDQLQAMPALVKLFAREARVMARIDHPNVLRVFDYGEGPEGPYIVTEWMSGGAIKSAADEAKLRAIASAAASGLQALHEASILHRDVKPANLFSREDGRIKLADLGVALAPENSADRAQFVGTIPYMAPELFEDPPSYGPSSDIYALGISLYQLWSGALPYHADDISTLVEQIRSATAKPLPALRGGLSTTFVKLLTAMMARDAAGRPAAAEIVRELTSASVVPRTPAISPTTLPTELPDVLAVGTPVPNQDLRVNAWICTQEVYRGQIWNTFFAHHRRTGRQVRLGMLLGDWLLPLPVMFDAARRSATWEHPSLISIIDWGTWQGRPYFVSPAIGQRLLELALARRILEVEALQLVEDLAGAVAYVHERGYVFQMVDPSAIGSRPTGSGYMLDWPAFAFPIGSTATSQTRYLSPFAAPEAAGSPTFETATDVYGIGSSLAYAFTGSPTWLASVQTGQLPDGLATSVTAATRTLLADLTHADPSARPSAADARDRAAAIRRRLEPAS